MNNWWENYPWRMIQTNLTEIDMADIDADGFVEELKDFNATVVNLNAAGILASYETKLPYHPKSDYLSGDSLLKIVEACHKAGIKVIARTDFSKIHHSVFEQHPDWVFRSKQGDVIDFNGYISTCPNGEYQQERMFDILQEVLSTHPFDGIFLNMSGFLFVDYNGKYYGQCFCESCKRKFKEDYGLDIPDKHDFSDPSFLKYIKFRQDCTTELNARLAKHVKSIRPGIAVNGLDYLRNESNTDIGRPPWVYSASSNSRLSDSQSGLIPSDNASVDFIGVRYRYISVSPALMELRQWQNLANSGCLSLYIMGTLGNHLDKSSFEGTRKVFRFHQDHQVLFQSMTSAAKVVLVRKGKWLQDLESLGWLRALTESHVPFDEVYLDNLKDINQLAGKDLVILGDLKAVSNSQAALFDRFVQDGGTLLATGETGLSNELSKPRSEMALKCLGVKQIKEKRSGLKSSMFLIQQDERHLFPACQNTPLIAAGDSLVLVESEDSVEKHLNLIQEHPFGPPEICYYQPSDMTGEPGVTVFGFGKGRGVHIPWKIGSFFYNEGYQLNSLNLMQDILFSICSLHNIAPDLTPMVEINARKTAHEMVVQLVNTSGCFATSFYAPLPVSDITLYPDIEDKVTQVKTLRGGKAEIMNENGRLVIHLDILKDYEAVILST